MAWRPLFDLFILVGGTGATLGLVIAILIAVPRGSQRRIAQLGLLPSIFNINEVIVFGLPIVFSPIYWLPFVLVPLILGCISLTAVHLGWVEMHPANIHWSTPQLISGWLITDSWRGALLQAVEIVISTALYFPFVRYAEAERHKHQREVFRDVIEIIPAEATERTMVIQRDDELGLVARSLLKELRYCIRNGTLYLYYQPKHDRAGQLVGVEALVRWVSRRHGPIPTPATITLAEDGGCVGELGTWVLEEVCACKSRWNALGYRGVSIAVNVSPSQLADRDFAPRLAATLQAHGLESREIEIEIIESQAIPDEADTNATLEALAVLGVRLSMDDFGMGYSSLLHLWRFNIHAIKIDGSLTRDVLTNSANADIISAIAALAKARNVEVVAEFVESAAQRQALADVGCDVFQGHFHSPALSEAKCLRYLASHYNAQDSN
jgi:EAL domain-containing protein (putative c-di-GMP-specific phosphodiesterase class I)